MTMLVIFAGLIGLAIKVAGDLFPRRVWGGPLGSALSLALGAVESFCLTPIMIAFHRFIILDEVAPGYVVDPGRPGFMEFFGWLVALSILAAIQTPVVLITVIVLSVRLIILFSGACGKCPRDECALHWLTAKVMSSRRTTCAQRVLRGLASDLPDAGVAMRLASILEARSTLSYVKRVRHRHGGSNDATGSARPRRPLGPNVRA
ncbi:MAG: hypothetical protein WA725_03030 [Pseudolabrys sp.]